MKSSIFVFSLLICAGSYDAFTINNPIKIGELSNKMHNIGGTVYVLNNNKIFIKGFTYDGTGPDAFFLVGESGTPNRVGTILSYPDNGKCYEYNDQSVPLLTQAFDGNDITLTLPCALDITKIKWLSVWCRAFSMDFGSILFPNNFDIDQDTESSPESEPESFVEPENDVDVVLKSKEELGDYLSPYPEAEPETEPETEE
jgi:hypothetical protein